MRIHCGPTTSHTIILKTEWLSLDGKDKKVREFFFKLKEGRKLLTENTLILCDGFAMTGKRSGGVAFFEEALNHQFKSEE